MENRLIKYIISVTGELHNDVTDIYEDLMDEDNIEALVKIDRTIGKLKHLKSNLVNKDS